MLRHSRVSLVTVIAACASVGYVAAPVSADPLPGEVLKFQQKPIDNLVIGTAIYQGHDEPSTAYAQVDATGVITGWQGTFMADDFADKFSTPVVHLRWWGSYINNAFGTNGGIKQFLISFETDVPQGTANSFSHPGQPLLSQVVNAGALAPGSGTFTETLINPNAPEHLFQYNAELAVPFAELPDTVYWLKVVALTSDSSQLWGWHDRDYTAFDPLASQPPVVIPGENLQGIPGTNLQVWHFQDDAVSGRLTVTAPTPPGGPIVGVFQDPASYAPQNYIDSIDGPPGIGTFSKDLAFELYTTPEPGTVSLAMLAAAGVILWRRR